MVQLLPPSPARISQFCDFPSLLLFSRIPSPFLQDTTPMSSTPFSLSTEGTLPSTVSPSNFWLSAPQSGCPFLSLSHNGFSPAPQDSDPIHEHRVNVLGPHFLLSTRLYCICPCISSNFCFYELNLSSQVVLIVLLLVFGFGWGLGLVNMFIELTSLIHSLTLTLTLQGFVLINFLV